MTDVPRGVFAVERRGNKTVGWAGAPRTTHFRAMAAMGTWRAGIVGDREGGVAARDERPSTSHSAHTVEVAPIHFVVLSTGQ